MTDEGIRLSFDGIDVRDFVNNSDKYDYKIEWEFRGSRSSSLAGGYGGDIANDELYILLGDDFITRYFEYNYKETNASKRAEEYLSAMNDDFFGIVQNVNETELELERLKRRVEIDSTRLDNANARALNLYDKKDELSGYLDYIYENAKKTKSGNIDRRTSDYSRYLEVSSELDIISEDIYKALKSYDREEKRYSNTKAKKEQVYANIMDYINGKESEYVQSMENEAISIADEIRDDIIRSAESGTLPLATKAVSKRTRRARKKAGLPETPRFYASGQFINSIAIVAKLRRIA